MKMVINSHKLAVEKIKQHNSIVIFHHVIPDGDCLGSQFGLKNLLQDNFPDKKIYCVGDSKNNFQFLDIKMDNNLVTEEVMKNSLAIVVDTSDKKWVENSYLLDKNLFLEVLRIDHHPNDEDNLNTKLKWVDSSYVACDEMIAHMALLENWKISKKAAEFLYLGINTDSGRFLFSNTSARTFHILWKLYETGFDANKLLLNMSLVSKDDFQYNAFLINSLKTYQNVAYIVTKQTDLKRFNKCSDDAVNVNLIANINGHPIWVQFIEMEDGKIKVKARSNGPSVRNICQEYNGGGHERASGCVLDSFSDIEGFLARCQQEIKTQ
ncbi:putative MgpA-like protein [Mycoplasmopsis synoviae 53]|uniref:Putative MgpA-like protein n=2 Tax=Mycoplasmopsis synoviae TaxID=2109 RepID=Q4A672_MYCS5|nr:bifunctional oligoribonuclease/PAP phosphatase NrnA [Mycoplasmopsis synoviae]AAZ43749.2 putative MgpA-like protein [Mycoplasmopsis synoviae 53]